VSQPGGSPILKNLQGPFSLLSRSAPGDVFHVFELKAKDNIGAGILSEVYYYARLLHYVRAGLPNGGKIGGGGSELDAVRRAKRIVAWLIAPTFHPLVYPLRRDGSAPDIPLDSPLHWINESTVAQGLEFRILPYALENKEVVWRPDLRWPA
jgi:hypothetical protein